jgi:hypothetical protein
MGVVDQSCVPTAGRNERAIVAPIESIEYPQTENRVTVRPLATRLCKPTTAKSLLYGVPILWYLVSVNSP